MLVRPRRRSTALLVPALLVGAATLPACGAVGAATPGAPSHHTDGGFRNVNPAFTRPAFWTRTAFFLRRSWEATFHPRSVSFPRVENDGRRLRENHAEATVTWVGHSTLLIQLDGVNLLTDPQWSGRASPVSFAGPRRVTPPGLRLEDLPPIDLVLISHDHYDHLDVSTVARLAATHHPRFVVPLGLKGWLAGLGITEVDELDWWDSRTFRGLTLTCLPAQHWGARSWWDQNRRLWSGWAVTGRTKRLYFAGDTGYYKPLFEEIGRRLGPFDLAAIPIGAYIPPAIMRLTHTTPEEALLVFADVRGRHFVGIHWGTFDLTDEPLDEPPARTLAEARRRGLDPDRIWLLRHGETRGW